MSDINRLDRNAPIPRGPDGLPVASEVTGPGGAAAGPAGAAGPLSAVPFAAAAAPPAVGENAPPLPDLTGPGTGAEADDQVQPAWLQMRPFSLAAVTEALIESQAQQQSAAVQNKALAGQSSYLLQVAGVNLTEKQIAGERRHAIEQLATSTLAAVAAGAVGFKGTHMTMTAGSAARPEMDAAATAKATANRAAIGSALSAGGQGVSQMINSLGEATSKLMPGFGQHEADEAKIQKAIVDSYVSLYKANEEMMGTVVDQNRRNLQAQMETERNVRRDLSQSLMTVAGNL